MDPSEVDARQVLDVMAGEDVKDLVTINGATATSGHPFLVVGEGWMDAGASISEQAVSSKSNVRLRRQSIEAAEIETETASKGGEPSASKERSKNEKANDHLQDSVDVNVGAGVRAGIGCTCTSPR